ncbi:MAG: hypothetical protein CMA72_07780 [Euryarchaeota archaeon]|nr:hypothetical protein [Euryarchaeota archaeon]
MTKNEMRYVGVSRNEEKRILNMQKKSGHIRGIIIRGEKRVQNGKVEVPQKEGKLGKHIMHTASIG